MYPSNCHWFSTQMSFKLLPSSSSNISGVFAAYYMLTFLSGFDSEPLQSKDVLSLIKAS